MRTLFAIALALVFFQSPSLEARTWTSLDGKIMEAEFVESDGTNVTFVRSDGRTFTLALEKFSEADREFVAQKLIESPADDKGDAPKVTGEIREPEDGDIVKREFAVKGRTRGAPRGFVAMLFRSQPKTEAFFPHNEYSDANRSFSIYLYHGETDLGEWGIHLYVLPEADAKALVGWLAKTAALSQSGQEDKIEPFDGELMEEAIQVASVKYFLDTD